MRLIIFLLFLLGAGCQNHAVEKDKRQIMAKDEIKKNLPHSASSFNITGFREDTLNWTDSAFNRPIRYRLEFEYKDSAGSLQRKTGDVLFTPDGRSIIGSMTH